MALASILSALAPAAIGAGVEGISRLFGSKSLSGRPEQVQQLSRYTPETQLNIDKLINQLLGSGQGEGLSFDPIADYATEQFEKRTLPSILERFATSSGTAGSSALNRAATQAGADLSSQLAAMKQQFGLQRQGQQQNLLSSLLGLGGRETLLRPASSGLGATTLQGSLQGLGTLLPLLAATGLGGQGSAASGNYSFLQPKL